MPLFDIPEVQINAGDSLDGAEVKVRSAFEEAGLDFSGMAWINSRLPKTIADECRFCCTRNDDSMLVIVLSVGSWQEKATLSVLNIALGLRLDPQRPGTKVRLRFFSAADVPSELLLIGGDTVFSEFEARACLIARFGEDLKPQNCQQMAAAGMYLSRSVLGTEVSFLDPGSPDQLAAAVCDKLDLEELPVDEPLNSMIVLGCLFGEMVRAQVDLESSWMALRQFESWPAVVFSRRKSTESDNVAFSPLDHIRGLIRSRDRAVLGRAIEELKTVCAG